MKKLLIITFCSVSIFCFSQKKVKNNKISKDIKFEKIATKLKKEILSQIVKNEKFIIACEILANQNEMIAYENATINKKGNNYEVSWRIVNEDKSKNVEYSKLVVDNDSKNYSVYFDLKNDKYKPYTKPNSSSAKLSWPPKWWPGGGSSSGSGGGNSGFCWWNWSSWTVIGNSCNYSFSCFFKNQKALFITETRYCNSNKNNVQTRTVKLHCGC